MKRLLGPLTCLAVALLFTFAAQESWAQGKGKKKGDDEAGAGDLFEGMGDLGGGGLGDLEQATEGVGPTKKKKTESLGLKQKVETGDGKVTVHRVFAAPKISMVKGKCVAKPKRVEFFVANDFPLEADRFSVCAQMSGGRPRAMRMSVMITTGRGKMIGSAESVVDFTGKTMIDHAIDFVPLDFPEAGVYRYVIDIEGTRVANMPLFEVRPQEAVEPAEELPE